MLALGFACSVSDPLTLSLNLKESPHQDEKDLWGENLHASLCCAPTDL